jgi:DNA polymerase-3 subunit alpha
VTFSQLHGRSAVRDVARVFGIDQETVSSITESIPLGSTIAKAVESDEGLAEKLKKTPWLRNAQRLEGTIRHASTHAAGIVIAGFPLTDKVALVRNLNGLPAVGLEMGDAEKVGLIKFDFLGLKTLALVERTVQMVMETTGEEIDTEAIEDGDSKTYALLGRGDTVGVFQLESAGMRKYLIDLRPETIHH